MFKRRLFLFTILLTLVFSIVVTVLTGFFIFIIVGLAPLIYSLGANVESSEAADKNPDKSHRQAFFCQYCGAPLKEEFLYCPKCGKELEKGRGVAR